MSVLNLPDMAIETRHLYKRFGEVIALEDINLYIAFGEFVAIMGASGSGKTTLMNILTCLDSVSEGQVFFNGIDAALLNEEERRRFRSQKIGLVFQQFHLISFLTALENVMLAQHYHSMIDEEAARVVLKQVGLDHRATHLPNQLSGGEQQRVCIARALVNEPPIIFADEPTGNLDEENAQRVLDLLQNLCRQGRTIILVTHNPALGYVADRIIWLQHGKHFDKKKTCHGKDREKII
ncbi:MAG: ABC transporter ATP-binding protein [Sodalis sp. (in: enterobacteria)]